MNKQASWFSVDREGLKQLQLGKPKHYVLRELIQNAWDENVKRVSVDLSYSGELAVISVEDDNPEGFKDLRDSYTLFKETAKRKDPEKRGRFNLGEKQAFAVCEKAVVSTTKGTITFDITGRANSDKKRNRGSKVELHIKMNQSEYDEMLEVVKSYLVPKNIEFYVKSQKYIYRKPFRVFEAPLLTEIAKNRVMRGTIRKTVVSLHKDPEPYLYEMGIPVMRVKCQYSIDVQQKIPLNADRETVSVSYLKDLFSEVLNCVYDDIDESASSEDWIRQGMSDSRVSKEAVGAVLKKRYGDKICVAALNDPNSVDEAISRGYTVLRGRELSKEEWERIRGFDSVPSSTELFGRSARVAACILPNDKQIKVADYAKKIAKRLLDIDIDVAFVKERGMVAAEFGNRRLTFNIAELGKSFFATTVSQQTTDLILHELGHYAGNHTDKSYHQLITKMAGQLVMIALREPKFFEDI